MKFCWIILATIVLYICNASAETPGEIHKVEKRDSDEDILRKRQETLDKIRAEIDAVTQAPCIPQNKPMQNDPGANYEEDDYEGDYENDDYEGDYEEGDYEEGDYEEGDYEEGDYEEGDYEEGDYEEGDYEEGDYYDRK